MIVMARVANNQKEKNMALNLEEVAIVKGLLATGMHRQSDIAAHYGINSARIAEINTGIKYPHIKPAPSTQLPDIPIHTKKKAAWISKRFDHCTERDRNINEARDGLYRDYERFQAYLERIQKRYRQLTNEENELIFQTLNQIATEYQILSQSLKK